MNRRFEPLCSNGKVRDALFLKNLGQLLLPDSIRNDWQYLVQKLVDQHPLSSLIDRCQPYLLNAVYQLNGDSYAEITINRFKIALVDCFHDLFPENTVVRIYNWHFPVVSFPSLGLQAETSDPDMVIQIVRSGVITVSEGSGAATLNPNRFTERLSAGQGLALIDNGHWFDEPLCGKMEERKTLLKMKSVIEDALELISLSALRLHQRIVEDIGSYMLVRADLPNAHHSFTTQSYPNAIFLSKDERRLTIAEAIVHEFSHHELDSILTFEQIHSGDEQEIYYSPWRNDIRPLRGLFHAVYVFNRVLDFYYSLDNRLLTEPEQQTVAYKKALIFHKLQIGLWQIKPGILEPTALAIFHSIKSKMNRLKQSREEKLTKPVQQELSVHLERWFKIYDPQKVNNKSKINHLLYGVV